MASTLVGLFWFFPPTDPLLTSNESTGAIAVTVGTAVAVGVVGVAVMGIAVLIATRHARKGSRMLLHEYTLTPYIYLHTYHTVTPQQHQPANKMMP